LNVNGPEDGREEILRPSTSPLRDLVRKRDFYAGGLMILFGLGIALKGATYRLGPEVEGDFLTKLNAWLTHMGPGFLPTVLGIILVLIGIAIAAAALSPSEEGDEASQRILPENPQWLAWLCILMSPVCFIIFGHYLGMAPATFSCVFVAALGDKGKTWLATLVLSTVVTVFGVGLFSYFLQVPMPIFTWGGGL
jgi:hypothetical protein